MLELCNKTKSSIHFNKRVLTAVLAITLAGGGVCGWSSAATAASGHVTVHVSNNSRSSAACKANNVDHIYVTVADIKAHRSGKGQNGFASLTSGSPQQFDLLFGSSESAEAFDTSDCPIVAMGGTGLAPGKYQQIRLLTVDNDTTINGAPAIAPADNACDSLGDTVYNCVDAGGVLSPLSIPSGSQTGIKIPSSQIAHGGFTIAAGQGVDLDLDINACRSLVVRGGANGHGHGHGHGKNKPNPGTATYALKPVFHAGEVSLQGIIAGSVVLGNPGSPVTATATTVPNATVWLESQASNVTEGNPAPSATLVPVNNVLAETTTDANGNFAFCPVPSDNYNIVVDAETLPGATTNPSDATITTGVSVTASGGPNNLVIPLLEGSAAAVTLNAQVTTTAATPPGLGDDIAFRGTQSFDNNDQAPIPLYTGTTTSPVTTVAAPASCTCPANTNCACLALVAPPDNPVTGVAGSSYSAGSGAATYSLLGNASAIGTNTAECTPSQLISTAQVSPLPTPTLSFSGCD